MVCSIKPGFSLYMVFSVSNDVEDVIILFVFLSTLKVRPQEQCSTIEFLYVKDDSIEVGNEEGNV